MKVANLSKTYRHKNGEVKALNDISMELPDRGLVFIRGKSGSGKTTLLDLLSGLDEADGGKIEICGKDIAHCTERERDKYRNTYCGFIFQEYNLMPELNVKENVKLSLELNGERDDGAVDRALESVGLSGYGDRKITELSGGQKQRVAIARAIVKRPRIIFADEPTGALDEQTGASIFELLNDISASTLVVAVSHDRASAEKYGDRVIELADGKIISDSDAGYESQATDGAELKTPRLSMKTAAKIGCINFKLHPVRFIATLLLSVAAFSFMGICLNIAVSDPESNYVKAVYADGYEFAAVCKQKADERYDGADSSLDGFFGGDGRHWKETIVKPADGKILNSVYGGPICYVQCVPIVDFQREVTMPIRQLLKETSTDERAFAVSANGFIHVDNADIAAMGFNVIGRLPENANEVAINENIFNTLSYGGVDVDGVNYTFESEYDILGFTLSVEQPYIDDNGNAGVIQGKFRRTVVGVVDTGCGKACASSHFDNVEHPHNKVFVCDGFIDHDGYADGSFIICKVDADFDKLANFVLHHENDGVRFRFSDGMSMGYYVASDNLRFVKYICLYSSAVLFVAAFVLLVNFIGASMRGQMKQIGILTALGADGKSLIKIYGSSVAVVCAAVFLLSTVFVAVAVSTFLNALIVEWSGASFRVLRFAPWIVAAMSGVVALCGITGLSIPLYSMRKLTPVDAIGKGQIK